MWKGGVGAYISNKHDFVHREDLEFVEIEGISVQFRMKNLKNILISTIYKPPNSSHHLSTNFNQSLQNMLSIVTKEKKELLLNVNYSVLSLLRTIFL